MKISIIRSSKIAIGTTLILMSLNQELFTAQIPTLLALAALPFVFAGLFNWTPLSFIVSKFKLIAPLFRQASA